MEGHYEERSTGTALISITSECVLGILMLFNIFRDLRDRNMHCILCYCVIVLFMGSYLPGYGCVYVWLPRKLRRRTSNPNLVRDFELIKSDPPGGM